MSLGIMEQTQLRFHLRRSIRRGALPPEAREFLTDPDAWQSFCDGVEQQAMTADTLALDGSLGSNGTTVAPKTHPILAWIAANLPQILALVMQLLPMFGVKVPSTPVSTTPLAPPPNALAAMPTDFALPAIPPNLLAIAEQIAAQSIQAILPILEKQLSEFLARWNTAARGGAA